MAINGGMFMLMVLFASISAAFDLFSNSTVDDIATKVGMAIALPLLFFGIGFVALPHLLRLRKPHRHLSPQAVTTAELVETPILSPLSSVTEQTTRNLEPLLQQRPTQYE